jgi:predicted metal-dependent hydrolase
MTTIKNLSIAQEGLCSTTPEYSVRESVRAKYVHLRMSYAKGLEVVVPKGYDLVGIPALIQGKKAWLERVQERLKLQIQNLPAEHFSARPVRIHLLAINKSYQVSYILDDKREIDLQESASRLLVSGPINDIPACTRALKHWLKSKGQQVLCPWLRQTSKELSLDYMKSSIRGQKTRWGSCSAIKVINLNYKLLFLPSEQVHYLFVHELCHTRHLNHSSQFWALVERKLPDFHRHESAMKEAWRFVPLWAD